MRAQTLEAEWEIDDDGGMLCVLRARELALKRLWAQFRKANPRGKTEELYGLARKWSRDIRKAGEMDFRDPTFGSQCWAAYVQRPNGKVEWWLNISTQPHGESKSVAEGRHEIMRRMARLETRFPISNLQELCSAAA